MFDEFIDVFLFELDGEKDLFHDLCVHERGINSITALLCVTITIIPMMLMEMTFCSHCWAAGLRASQMDLISVETPLICYQSLAHPSWYFLLPQKIEIESIWDNSCTRGTICWPRASEMIMQTFSSVISSKNWRHSWASVNVWIVLTVRPRWVMVFRHLTRWGEHFGPCVYWFDSLLCLHLWKK